MKSFKFLAMLLFTALVSSAWATNKILSGSESYEAQDGDVLTGLTSGTVSIANGAKITLSDVTISGGIVCSGTAEITLVGTNSVSGATNMAGIQVGGSGTTLTIKGNGSLTANGANNSAGIGLSRAWKVDATGGDIVIEGGNITATGKGMGAGIGTGVSFGDDANHTATIGNITIKGGTVTAIGGTNQYFPGSGIGKGGAYSYGNTVVGTVTITTDIDLVDASSISEIVTYKHGETDVTSIASDYFTINEDGNRRIIVPKDDIDYNVTIDEEITGGTVTADKTTAKAGELVALTVTPESGYVLQSLTVKDASDNDVSLSNREFVMPRGGVTVSATFIQTTAAFDEATGVLTLNGNVDADEVKAFGAIIGDYGAIVKESPVTSVVCEPGTVLPADCSELFLNYTNLITIDLSNADISGVTNMSKMFGSRSLTTIYVNSAWSMENVTSSDQMFYGCNLLRGGNGSRWEDVRVAVWESNGNDLEAAKAKASRSSYAIIDGKGGLPGYLTVKPKQTPSAPTANVITYTGEAQELVSAGDGTMLYSLDDGIYSAEIPTATAAGTYTVHYKVDGSDNWNAVIAQTVEVTIAPKALSITAKNKTIAYGDEPANDGVEYSGFVATDNEDSLNGTLIYSFDYKQYDEVGKYTITPSGLTSDNYDITFVDGELTVEQKKLTVTAKNDTITYGDEPPNASVEYSGFVGEEDESVLNGSLAYECKYDRGGAAGKYDVTPGGLTAENYDIEFVAGELTVEPKVVSIAWGEQTVFVYNGSEQIPTATAEGLLEGDDCELTVTGAAKNAGNYTATVTGLSNPNYKMRASGTKQDFEILKADPTMVKAPVAVENLVYSGKAQTLVVAGEAQNGVMVYKLEGADSYTEALPSATEAGDYTVYFMVQGDENYNDTKVQAVTATITKAPLTITAKDKTIVYGDEPANDGVEYNGFLGSDDASVLGGTLTYGYNYEIWNDTGEYTITPNGLTADNYNITFVNGTLTVEPKRRKFAAVTIEDDQDGRTAVLDCSYDRDDEINLPEYEDGIVVNAIKVKRTFGINTPATIVLPFKLPTETRTNADFYDLYSVEQVGNTWKARMEKIPDGHIQPLHPYAIIVYEEELTFDLQGKHVTVYMDENEIDTVKSQDKLWYFVGVYQYKTWGDKDKELGLAYAFAGRNEHNIAKGQFGKIAAGGYAYPLRAYLRKKDASVQLKPVQNRPLASGEQRAASVASLFSEDNTPETIEVEFFEKDQNGEEHTTFIGRMDTRTGEFSSIRPSRTFDLKGRHVGKPKAKGAYFKK